MCIQGLICVKYSYACVKKYRCEHMLSGLLEVSGRTHRKMINDKNDSERIKWKENLVFVIFFSDTF